MQKLYTIHSACIFDTYVKVHQYASGCLKMHQYASKCINVYRIYCANVLCGNLSKKWFLLHLIRVNMHQYASECLKMHQNICRMNYFNVLCMKFQFEKFQFFWLKMTNFFSKCSECINMHQNASKCVQNEICKCFMHEIIKEVVLI